MSKPRLLDLFCGAGGAAMGYSRAGFDVVGVDIKPQPHYPFEFHQADAMTYPLEGFDAIHASPPCQAFTQMSNRWRGKGGKADQHINLLTPTLERLHEQTTPWVVENVVGAKSAMPNRFVLHGGMFGLGVHRPRFFECSFLVLHASMASVISPLGVYGKMDGRRLFTRADGTEQRAASDLAEAQKAMGIDWMDWDELKEAIPPAYTELIGSQLLALVAA